jgi:hypothetical protein
MRHSSIFSLRAAVPSITFLILYLVFAIIRGTRSDSGDVFTVVRKLFPAGTCLCESSASFSCGEVLEEVFEAANQNSLNTTPSTDWQFQYGRDDRNVGLTAEQCSSAFPGLFEDIRRGINDHQFDPIFEDQLKAVELGRGMARAMIFEGKVSSTTRSSSL